MKTKKIIFLIPTLSIGGGERVVSQLSLNLPKSIERVIVLFKKQIAYPYRGSVISLDIPVSQNPFLKVYYYITGLVRFRKIIKKENPDFVVSFGQPANIINLLSGSQAIVRVDNFYSASCRGLGGKIYKILIRFLFNRAKIIIVVAKASALDLVKNFGVRKEKIKVIYNPLNAEEIKKQSKEPLEEKYQKIFEKPVIINMGRLTKQKNQQHLIEAFQALKIAMPKAQLVILGEGMLEKKLKQLAQELGLEKDIHFLGWQENPFKFLARAKAFALSSAWEGLPYVLLEAMACGLPVVSFDCKSGPREILAPDTTPNSQTKNIEYAKYGILVAPGNTALLSKALIKILLVEPGLAEKFGKKSKERMLDFNIKKIIKEWKFLKNDKKT